MVLLGTTTLTLAVLLGATLTSVRKLISHQFLAQASVEQFFPTKFSTIDLKILLPLQLFQGQLFLLLLSDLISGALIPSGWLVPCGVRWGPL